MGTDEEHGDRNMEEHGDRNMGTDGTIPNHLA